MRLFHSRSWVHATCTGALFTLVTFVACSDDNDAQPNKTPSGGSDAGADQSTAPLPDTGPVDGAPVDSATCDYEQKTADGGACDLRKTHVVMSRFAQSCEVITRGQFCDRIVFHVPADAGASVSAIAPSFKCEPQGQGLQCAWEDPPSQLDESGFSQICAVTTSSISLTDEGIMCMIYL